MLICAWFAISFTTAVFAQQTHTRINQNGASFEWGWQMKPGQDANGHQYTTFLNIPQISTQEPQTLSSIQDNAGQATLTGPVEIILLPTPTPAADQSFLQILPTPLPNVQYTSVPNFINGQSQYFIHHIQDENRNDKDVRINDYGSSTPLYEKENVDSEGKPTPVVTVYKNHNCSNDKIAAEKVGKKHKSDLKEHDIPTAEFESYKTFNSNENFGLTQNTEPPLTYKGAVNFRVEEPSDKYRSERYFYNREEDISTTEKAEMLTKDQLEKLVSSTQDLITNEDLLRINYAVEKHVNPLYEDIIKPRNLKARYSVRPDQAKHNTNPNSANKYLKPKSTISFKTKTGDLVNTSIEHDQNNNNKEKVPYNSNEHEFASPIVVPDSTYDFKSKVTNNLVSTMVPYLENGYELVSVKHMYDDRKSGANSKEVLVTPRPIGQKYLSPITVALRLLNSNVTEIFNTIEDHEGSDSEIVSDTVENPKKLRTIVEVQESLPVEITHINDVEVHEYLNEGRINDNSLAVTKNLYNIYVDAKQKFQENMNDLLKKYADSGEFEDNSKENLEPSENIQSSVEVRPNGQKEYIRHRYNEYETDNRKIIQPIVVEKEVPVTQFVDRYIEKPVPYPNPYPVYKEVPVDRPVAYPVPVEKVVEKPVQVTKFVDKPYPVPLKVPHPYPVEVKVPYPVEKKVFVDRPVHVPYPVEKIIEKQIIHPYPVPTPVAVPVEVQVPVEVPKPVDRIVEKEVRVPYAVEKKVPYPVPYETKVPVPYPVERRVPVPVDRIVEKPVTVTKFVEKPVRIEVPVPQPIPITVHVPHPYPVNRVIEKKIPYPVPVDRIVEKRIPIKVPYPVEKFVERIVEKPVVITKFVDKPYPVEKMVPYPVDRIIEKKVPYPVQVPVEVKVPYPVEKGYDKHIPIKVSYYDKQGKSEDQQRAMYNYGYGFESQPSLYVPQYQKYVQNGNHQHLKDRKEKSLPMILSAHWGNGYASSFQYINNTKSAMDASTKNFIKFLNEQTPKEYYGPPPLQQAQNQWDTNEKIRRTDRVARVTNLRIEYGFKPPMVPSTEVDVDGLPVKSEAES